MSPIRLFGTWNSWEFMMAKIYMGTRAAPSMALAVSPGHTVAIIGCHVRFTHFIGSWRVLWRVLWRLLWRLSVAFGAKDSIKEIGQLLLRERMSPVILLSSFLLASVPVRGHF